MFMRLLTLLIIALPGLSLASAQTLRLQEAWKKAAQNSPEILNQRQAELAQKEKARQFNWWEDPTVEYAQTSKSLQGTHSRITTLGLRQRLPLGADRQSEKVLEQGLVKWEETKTQLSERTQQNAFVRWLYQYKVATIEKEHIAERLKMLQSLRSHLSKTQAYTPSSQLERGLIEIRLQELDRMKLEVDSRWREARDTLELWGMSPEKTPVSIPWLDEGLIKKNIESENPTPLAVKGMESLVEAKKSRAEVSVWRPQLDVFYTQALESGGAEEEDRTLGLSLSLPLFSGLSPKKNMKRAEAMAEEAKLEVSRREANLEWNLLQSKAQVVLSTFKMLPMSQLPQMEKKVEGYVDALRKKQISVLQFLDYEGKVHEQVETIYSNQLEALGILTAINLRSEKNIVEVLEAVNGQTP